MASVVGFVDDELDSDWLTGCMFISLSEALVNSSPRLCALFGGVSSSVIGSISGLGSVSAKLKLFRGCNEANNKVRDIQSVYDQSQTEKKLFHTVNHSQCHW